MINDRGDRREDHAVEPRARVDAASDERHHDMHPTPGRFVARAAVAGGGGWHLGSGRTWLIVVAFAAVVVAPFANALGAWGQGWVPFGDNAEIVARAYDVGTRLTPLIGPPSTFQEVSRFSPSSLGPLEYWLIAPFVRVFGPTVGAAVGAAAVIAASLVAIGRVALRRLGAAAMVLALTCGVLALTTLVGQWSFEPLKSLVPVMPLLATIFLTWAVIDGSRWAIPAVLGFGSYAAQGHLEFVTSVALLWAVAGIRLVQRLRWHQRPRFTTAPSGEGAKVALASAIVVIVCWVGPVVDAVRHRGGNLREILDQLFASTSTAGLPGAIRGLGAVLNLPPYSASHTEAASVRGLDPTALIPIAAMLWVVWLARRQRSTQLLRLVVVVLVALVGASLTAAQLPVQKFDANHVNFVQPVWAFMCFVVALACWQAVRSRRALVAPLLVIGSVPVSMATGGWLPVPLLVGLAVVWAFVAIAGARWAARDAPLVIAGGILVVVTAMGLGRPPVLAASYQAWMYEGIPVMAAAVGKTLPKAQASPNAYLLWTTGGDFYLAAGKGLAAQLRSQHVPVVVPDGLGPAFGERHALGVNTPNVRGTIALLPEYADRLPQGAVRLASWRPTPSAEAMAPDELEAAVARFVRGNGDLRLSRAARARVCEIFAFTSLFPPDRPCVPGESAVSAAEVLRVPGALLALHENGWISSPELPRELQDHVDRAGTVGAPVAVWFFPSVPPVVQGGAPSPS